MARAILTVAAASALGLSATGSAHAAGFFDDFARVFFGGRPSAPSAVTSPFETTVKPSRQKPRPAVPAKPAEPAVKLDPASDPHWYLSDPTLRKGDIVVTRSGVVVFSGRGGARHSPAAFTALDESRRLSKAQLQLLQAAAGGRAYFSARPAPNPPATVQPAVVGATAQAQ